MANGYDTHSLAATRLNEAASSSDVAPMVAVRDKRFTRNGIGFRSQATEAAARDYPGGVANRRRGQVDESKLPWETAQEATTPPIRPRDTLPPSGLREALPPWLRGKDEEEQKEALPPWLQDKKDAEKESARPVQENWFEDDGEVPDCGNGFPDEWQARNALSTLAQFVDGGTLKAIQNQIKQTYPGADREEGDSAPVPAYMGEAQGSLAEAPLNAKKRNDLDNSDFALPGRKYPIDTPERARSALARVKQFGSPEDQRKVKAAVQKKYPNMKVD
ncbi:hypothetical protein ACFW2V_14010 [Streptomyces sp. NPDC058947]|uniref:hypothetical protein n=1 Tax=Streptomyces sp. NPDC058947 TaxID=3346675 RepID=UPI003677A9BC